MLSPGHPCLGVSSLPMQYRLTCPVGGAREKRQAASCTSHQGCRRISSLDSARTDVTESDFRERVRGVLAGLGSAVEQAIIDQLSRRGETGSESAVFFLVCPHRYGIWLLEEEEPVLPPDRIISGLGSWYRQAVQDEQFDAQADVRREVLPWLADRWAAVKGPGRLGRAIAFYDDPMSGECKPCQPWYDLEQRRWVWDEAPSGDRPRPQSGDIPF
jgi:hypothetical protein